MSAPEQTSLGIVVVGAGFGGRYAARRLARRLPAQFKITLIDRNDYMLYTPMLTEVAGRSVSPQHIQAPTRDLPSRVEFLQGEVTAANLRDRSVTLATGQVLRADHLVFALGSTTNYRNVPGAQENSVTMKTLEDARRVRTVAQRNVELAARQHDAEQRKRLLTLVVAGGGYTGVETVAAVNDLVRDTAAQHSIRPAELRVVMIEPTNRLMAEMPESLGRYGLEQLKKDGIEVLIGVGVKSVEPGVVTLTDGQSIPFGILVWDTGITPNPLVQAIPIPKGAKGGIAVDSTFQVHGMNGVWAIGDCAEIPKPDGSGHFFEATAQNATREGPLVADNIVATLRGQKPKPFRYRQLGELAAISRRKGVAFVFGIKVSGFLGWILWRAVYLAKMPGMAQKIGILSDWIRLALNRKYVPVTWKLRPSSDR